MHKFHVNMKSDNLQLLITTFSNLGPDFNILTCCDEMLGVMQNMTKSAYSLEKYLAKYDIPSPLAVTSDMALCLSSYIDAIRCSLYDNLWFYSSECALHLYSRWLVGKWLTNFTNTCMELITNDDFMKILIEQCKNENGRNLDQCLIIDSM